ncbi:MAG: NAD(P)-dependent oxidoreductase [Pirellula sp.]
MKALVVAANSFLGKEVCRSFQSRSVTAVGTARSSQSNELLTLDLLDASSIRKSLLDVQPNIIVQCAAATKSHDPQELYRVHVMGTLNLLQQAADVAPAAKIILLGSAAEYGNVPASQLPIDENYPCAPTSFFGCSKWAQCQLAEQAALAWNLRIGYMRPFNICGPGIPQHYFLGSLAMRARANRDLRKDERACLTIQNAHATRDFIDVRDVATAITTLSLSNLLTRGECSIWNIASGVERSILEVASILCQIAEVGFVSSQGESESRSSVVRSCGSSLKLQSLMDWRVTIPMEESIRDQWTGLQENEREFLVGVNRA